MQLLSLLAPFVMSTLVASQGSDDGQPTDVGLQDSVWAFGSSKCRNSQSQVDEIMIDCVDPRSAQKPFTTHSADEYTDTVPTAFKSFHGSNAGLNACVVSAMPIDTGYKEENKALIVGLQYSFNSTTMNVAPTDFKYALAGVKVLSTECSNVPKTHTLSFLNKPQKIKKIQKTRRSGSLSAFPQTHGSAVQGDPHHRYICLLENTCRVGNL
jgi:hypothetical protein